MNKNSKSSKTPPIHVFWALRLALTWAFGSILMWENGDKCSILRKFSISTSYWYLFWPKRQSKHDNFGQLVCFSICKEYEHIEEQCLKEAKNTEELMEQQAFIENARSLGTLQLTDRIKEVKVRLDYLLNNHLFSPEDIELNSMTVTWPKRIQPIFDKNDEVCFFFHFWRFCLIQVVGKTGSTPRYPSPKYLNSKIT